jgi:hypothetical protein
MNLPLGFTDTATDALPLHVVSRATLADWRAAQEPAVGTWLDAQGFDGSAGAAMAWAGSDGQLAGAVLGIGDALDPYSYGHAPFALPARTWQPAADLDAAAPRAAPGQKHCATATSSAAAARAAAGGGNDGDDAEPFDPRPPACACVTRQHADRAWVRTSSSRSPARSRSAMARRSR